MASFPEECFIELTFPQVIYKNNKFEIINSGVSFTNYALNITGGAIAISVNIVANPLQISASGNGASVSAKLEGNNPVFTIESLPAGTYIWSYAASIPDGCNGETEGEFVVLDQQAPVPNPLGCAGSFEPTERCTDNFIKFRTLTCPGQVFTPSKSGKYFEDLEGISLTRIADVTTEKYKGVADFVNSRLSKR
jgi:hypothetical protein